MGIRILFAVMVLGAITGCVVASEEQEAGQAPDVTQFQQETELTAEPPKPEMQLVPRDIEAALNQSALINGTGNLSTLVEANTSAGDYAFGQLEVVGTDNTRWTYQMTSSNATGNCYVAAGITVDNANKVLFRGHAITPDQQVAYSGTGLYDEKWDHGVQYSGNVQFITRSDGVASLAIIDVRNEQGTITHLTRAYHVIGNSSADTVRTSIIPGLEWNPARPESGSAQSILFYDQYAGSFVNMSSGIMNRYHASARSNPDRAYTLNEQNVGNSGFLDISTMSEEWPAGHLQGPGRGIEQSFSADQVTALIHQGSSWFSQGNGSAFGKTEGCGQYLEYWAVSSEDQNPLREVLGVTKGHVYGGEGGIIPASFSGWLLAEKEEGICRNSEQYALKGAYFNRSVYGGRFTRNYIPEWGVNSSISAGREGRPPGGSHLQGMAVLTVNKADADTTTLNGRWVATTPAGIPVRREIQALMPNTPASSTSSTVNGYRDIRERGYYRHSMVDVT